MVNKIIIAVLIVMLVGLQYKFWFSEDSLPNVWQLQQQLIAQKKKNDLLNEANKTRLKEIENLKNGKAAVAEKAREEYGMIGKNETFYRVLPGQKP